MMPHRAQQQLALEHAEGSLHHGQLDVGLPELHSRPAVLIAPQQVDAVAGQGRPKLLPKPAPAQLRRLGLRHGDRHEWTRLGEAALQATDTLEDLDTVLQATPLDPVLEPLQAARQATPLTAADGTLLLTSRPASRQQIVHALPLQQLHFDFGIVFEALPGAGTQLLDERAQLAAARGEQLAPARSAEKLH